MPRFGSQVSQTSRSRSRSRARSRSSVRPSGQGAMSVYKPQLARRVRFGKTDSGYFKITRRCSTILLANNGNTTLTAYDGTGSLFNLGAAVAELGTNAFAYPFSMSFRLDQLLNYSDLTSIADYYRIKNVTVLVTCNATNNPVDGVASMPLCYWDEDYDDDVLPTVGQVRERMGTKQFQFGNGKTHNMTLSPKVSPIVQNAGTANAYSVPVRATWINSASPKVPHYGIKGYLSNVYCVNQQQISFKFDVVFDVECKDLQ